jgi:putative transposase
MAAAATLGQTVGLAPACAALGVSRATLYRHRQPPTATVERAKSPRSLTDQEQAAVLAQLNSARFLDCAVAEVYATLLDEGTYLCSIRTMYRLLEAQGEVRERRQQRQHPPYTRPELLATAPNQLWSWDITKLHGPSKWTYFQLYVIIDVFSRYVVGWMVAHRESGVLAERLIRLSCEKHQIPRGQLILHADRGTSMTSKTVAFLLADLGVTKSHSRPHVSNDNPFSEAQFKTLKYQPAFPKQFGCLQDARAFCQQFFTWYNQEHHHGGIGLLTPAMMHSGQAQIVTQQRQQVLTAAFQAHPERFVHHPPRPPIVPTAVWINPPIVPPKSEEALH